MTARRVATTDYTQATVASRRRIYVGCGLLTIAAMKGWCSDMDSKKQVMVFAMGATALLTLATSVIVGAHYWEMLSGIWLIAIVGLLLPDWVAYWSTYWYAKAGQDQRVKVAAMITAFGMALTMILNAGAVLAVSWDNKEKAGFQEATAGRKNAAASDRADDVARMKAVGVSDRAIQSYLRAESEREKRQALQRKDKGKEAAPDAEAVYVSKVPEPIQRYMVFWVYIVPFLVGLIGKAIVVASIALPGGAEFGKSPGKHGPGFRPAAGGGLSPATARREADIDPN